MRLPIKPLCEQKRVRSDGTSMIFLQYCYDAEHKSFLSTEIPIPPEFWTRQQLCVKETLPSDYGNFEKINDDIDRQLNHAGDLINLAKRQGIAEIGAYVKEKYNPKLNLNLLAAADFQLKSGYALQGSFLLIQISSDQMKQPPAGLYFLSFP